MFFHITCNFNKFRIGGFGMTGFAAKIAELGLILPPAPNPSANYLPYVQTGNLLFISGQVSQTAGGVITGRLGADMDLAAGILAAQASALAILAQLHAALAGDLERMQRLVKLTGFVTATPEFTQIPQVINGASDLMVAVFGQRGRHARTAVAAPILPRGAAVEIDAIFEVT
jgi:enamine deaminase RidA (YjgF/YER057c/UK114 family)